VKICVICGKNFHKMQFFVHPQQSVWHSLSIVFVENSVR